MPKCLRSHPRRQNVESMFFRDRLVDRKQDTFTWSSPFYVVTLKSEEGAINVTAGESGHTCKLEHYTYQDTNPHHNTDDFWVHTKFHQNIKNY